MSEERNGTEPVDDMQGDDGVDSYLATDQGFASLGIEEIQGFLGAVETLFYLCNKETQMRREGSRRYQSMRSILDGIIEMMLGAVRIGHDMKTGVGLVERIREMREEAQRTRECGATDGEDDSGTRGGRLT